MKNSNVSLLLRFIHLCTVIELGILSPQLVSAQDAIKTVVRVSPPYPYSANEITDMGDQTIITIQNTDLNSGYSLKLGVELIGDNGVIVRSKENAIPSQPMDILPGETILLTGHEMSSFYNNYSDNDFDVIGISKSPIIRKNQLPEGDYTVCVRAYDYNTGIPLSAPSPLGCATPFSIKAQVPAIISIESIAVQDDKVILRWDYRESESQTILVYRTENDQSFELIDQVENDGFFVDYNILPGKTYKYKIGVLTPSGYCSPLSEEVRIKFK